MRKAGTHPHLWYAIFLTVEMYEHTQMFVNAYLFWKDIPYTLSDDSVYIWTKGLELATALPVLNGSEWDCPWIVFEGMAPNQISSLWPESASFPSPVQTEY